MNRPTTLPLAALLLIGALLLSACGTGPGPGPVVFPVSSPTPFPTAAPKVNAVTFIASDDGLLGSDGVPPGWTELTLRNEGQRPHQLQLLGLPEGRGLDELITALDGSGGRLPDWVTAAGGPNTVAPGETSVALVNLTTGQYAVVSLAPDPTGRPEAVAGFARLLAVGEAVAGAVLEPGGEVAIDLQDGSFGLTASIAAGRRTLRVNNTGSEPHELAVIRLEQNASLESLVDALGERAELPGVPAGGLAAIAPGTYAYTTLEFASGRYAFVCLMRSADGRTHAEQGMVLEVEVP